LNLPQVNLFVEGNWLRISAVHDQTGLSLPKNAGSPSIQNSPSQSHVPVPVSRGWVSESGHGETETS
jgi:hypothetical protein